MAQPGELVVPQVNLVHPRAGPESRGGEVRDVIVGEVQQRKVSEFGYVPGDFHESVVRQIESLQRVHPVAGGADGKVAQLVVRGVQLDLERKEEGGGGREGEGRGGEGRGGKERGEERLTE